MELLYQLGGLRGPEIGAIFGEDYSLVSQVRKQLREKLATELKIKIAMDRVEKKISTARKDLTPGFRFSAKVSLQTDETSRRNKTRNVKIKEKEGLWSVLLYEMSRNHDSTGAISLSGLTFQEFIKKRWPVVKKDSAAKPL